MIQVDLCRVSADGNYIDIIVEANHPFQQVLITLFEGEVYNLQLTDLQLLQKKLVLKIPTALVGDSNGYKMYGIYFKENMPSEEVKCSKDGLAYAVCSDISIVYRYLIDALMGLCCESCDVEIPLEVQRMYTLLYAHLQAMKLGDFDNAFHFYKFLMKKFGSGCNPNPCDKVAYQGSGKTSKGCGCKK